MCESRREPGAEREPRGNRRLSVARAVHEPTRSESEGEPSGGAARPDAAKRQNISQGGSSPTIGRAYARNASVTSWPFFAMYSFGTDLVYFAAF